MASTKILEQKKKVIGEIKEQITSATVVILTDYRGMSVKEVTDLKTKLLKDNSQYKVYKNTLIERALPEASSSLKEFLIGPVAILLGFEDPILPTKSLVSFIKENEKPKILGGLIDSRILNEKEINKLAKLPSKEELIAKVVWGVKSPLSGLVNVLQGPIRKLAYALQDLKSKKEKEGK